MQDRMTTATHSAWRSDTPPTNRVLEVWFYNAPILATFDGHLWRTCDGAELPGVTHWRVAK